MIPLEDVKDIITDLDNLRIKHENSQDYEACQCVNKINDRLKAYVKGALTENDHEEILPLLYQVCFTRYMFRLHIYQGDRFVAYIIPNNKLVYFYVDNVLDNSIAWQELEEEEQKVKSVIDMNIIKYFSKNS